MTAPTAPLTEFAGETLPGRDAELLSTEYSGGDPTIWADGAEQIASACLNHVLPDDAPSSEPWAALYQAAVGKPADQIEDAIYDQLNQLQQPLQMAVYSYLSIKIQQTANRYQSMKLGAAPGAGKKRRITTRLIESPDPALKRQIENELIPDKRPAVIRHASVEALLLNWLQAHGKFLRSEEEFFYLYDTDHRLFDMDTERWQAFIHTLTGVNPGSSVFGQLVAAGKTAAINNAEAAQVVKFAHYDLDNQVLRVSRFDGTVYALDGTNITEETNGAGPAIFYDFPSWQAYSVEETTFDYLHKLGMLPMWRTDSDLYSWVFQVWVRTLFFTEMCPTRPIMVFLGEKGSGKSMVLRLLMKLLFGSVADISGIPDKPDAFAVAAHHYHLYALDNMDTLEAWMRDKLARISTGATDEYRKLYTSKEMGIIRYRCWLAVTARTPDTLRRDDLADRVIILPLKRIEDDARDRELDFMQWAARNRNAFWGQLLQELNKIVAELRAGSIPVASPLRMADWEALGRIISNLNDKADCWDRLVDVIKTEQGNFLAEGEVIIEAIEAWLTNPTHLLQSNVGRWVTARELFEESKNLLFSGSKPDSDWPRSVKSFGWRLKNISDYLKARFGMKMVEDKHSKQVKYSFDHP
jgi:hypothetical protein